MASSDSSTDVPHAQMRGLTISDADPDAPDAKRAKREQLDSQVPSYGEAVNSLNDMEPERSTPSSSGVHHVTDEWPGFASVDVGGCDRIWTRDGTEVWVQYPPQGDWWKSIAAAGVVRT